jgi:hypothetical protein
MLHAYVERFDVMGERENILDWDGEVNKASVDLTCTPCPFALPSSTAFRSETSLQL